LNGKKFVVEYIDCAAVGGDCGERERLSLAVPRVLAIW
jgi:hypothetical protein